MHRSSLAAADWLQLNGPFNLFQIDTSRSACADGGRRVRTAGSPLAAIEIRQDSITGPILTTANLVSTGSTAAWAIDRRAAIALTLRASTSCSSCSGRSRAGTTGSNLFNLNWAEFGGNGVTVSETARRAARGGTVPATLSLSLGTPASFGPFTPGVAKTYSASTTANVISTAGDATLSVADPSPIATGHLVNGTFSLPQP